MDLDFIKGLHKSSGKNAILVGVYKLTKYGQLVMHSYFASSVSKLLHKIFRLHGVPQSIISDKNKLFTNLFWKEFLNA